VKNQKFGSAIAKLRREKGMTQQELAERMGVTDKAVSKWERDLSFPDISSIPRLAEIFDVSVDDLMQAKAVPKEKPLQKEMAELTHLVCRCVALGMGVAVFVLSLMNRTDADGAVKMLGIGLACLAADVLHWDRTKIGR